MTRSVNWDRSTVFRLSTLKARGRLFVVSRQGQVVVVDEGPVPPSVDFFWRDGIDVIPARTDRRAARRLRDALPLAAPVGGSSNT